MLWNELLANLAIVALASSIWTAAFLDVIPPEPALITKADALNEAKTRLLAAQAKMTAAMEMAVHVETLLETVSLKDARQFLRVECGIPTTNLKAFASLKVTFGDSRKLIEAKGVPFTFRQGSRRYRSRYTRRSRWADRPGVHAGHERHREDSQAWYGSGKSDAEARAQA